VRRVSKDGKIATIAGDGQPGFSGDGGLATKARLDRPLGIAVDAAGNVYVADQVNRRVRKISPDGKMTTFAGSGAYGSPDKFETIPDNAGDGGPATSAILMEPTSVAVDAHGAVYILVWDRIRVVGPDGIISTFAKVDPDTTAIAVNADGDVYASIGTKNQIVKFSASSATR
jgi:sugar lactone lactonase YvrE